MEQGFQMDLDDEIDSSNLNEKYNINNINNSNDRYISDDDMLDGTENTNARIEEYLEFEEVKLKTNKNGDGDFTNGVKIKKVLKNLDSGLGRYDQTQIYRQEFAPPENFSHVVGEIYRSSFPRTENFPYLKKLQLKTILFLVPEEYPEENLIFAKENNINVFQVSMSGNKEPFVKIPDEVLTKALEIAIDPKNHPLLIHCNRGKHRTGCLVGCIRRLQNWSLTMILDEYRRFASPKIRPLDQQFIELYNDEEITRISKEKKWLPIKW